MRRPDVVQVEIEALDESAEEQLYALLRDRLPRATIVSIGHRSSLRAYHRRHLRFARMGGSARPVDAEA